MDTNRTKSDTRNNCIKLMYNGLAYRSAEHQDVVLAKAVAVEDAAFRMFGGDEKHKEYPKKIRSLFQNLKNKTNAELGRRVMAGDIPPDRFVKLSDAELLSAEQRKTNELYEKENMKKAQVPMAEKSVSSEFKCARCGEKKVSYSQAQTRSADEPMTTFCECTICGNRWKVSYDPLRSLFPLYPSLFFCIRASLYQNRGANCPPSFPKQCNVHMAAGQAAPRAFPDASSTAPPLPCSFRWFGSSRYPRRLSS